MGLEAGLTLDATVAVSRLLTRYERMSALNTVGWMVQLVVRRHTSANRGRQHRDQRVRQAAGPTCTDPHESLDRPVLFYIRDELKSQNLLRSLP